MKRGYFVKTVFEAVLLTVLLAFLFYRSTWGCLLFPVLIYLLYQKRLQSEEEEEKRLLEEQFVNGIRVLNTSLQAGLSMENAWKEVQKETELLYGKDAVFYKEVREINASVEMNLPLEKLVLDFAYRNGLEDMISFAEIFEYGKRCGGNWKNIIDTTVMHINEKYEARKEIEVMIAEKKMEQSIMNIIPLGLLAFLQISAWDYMSVLYHNFFGVICMTICLLGYMASIMLSQKILQIKV